MYKNVLSINNQMELFEKSLPFGDHLNRHNRWIQLATLVDWEGFERSYAQKFSHTGRPALSARIVIGALILKHILEVSDEELTQQLRENPYMQFFIGLERFQDDPPFHSSTLSRVRERLGEKDFEAFERYIITDLVSKKLIKPKGLLVDATVFENEISFPTDCGLLNKARQFCVKKIKKLSKIVGRKVRTYCRVAQQSYLSFTKKRKKTTKQIRHMQKSLLQYLRRNIRQLTELIDDVEQQGHVVSQNIKETFTTVKKIYRQQKQMYDQRIHSIENRIVSLSKPYLRPIVRNKSGKKVEFGPKVTASMVDGYLLFDHLGYENYNESGLLSENVERFRKRFGKDPKYVSMDQLYGSRSNRAYLKREQIRTSVKPLGRRRHGQSNQAERRWRRQKQKERNQIEGGFGVSKRSYLLGKVRAKNRKTEYSWIRMGLLGQNLMTAAQRV
jgi:IS5 family transposase